MNAQCNYDIAYKGLLEECNKEENGAVTVATTTASCYKRRP